MFHMDMDRVIEMERIELPEGSGTGKAGLVEAYNALILAIEELRSFGGGTVGADHTHPVSGVDGLQAALDGKAALDHGHDRYLTDAPGDGKQYARRSGAWSEVVPSGGGGGNGVSVDDDVVNVKSYGARGDGIKCAVSVSAGSKTVTISGASVPSGWASGKTVAIMGAGPGGVPHVATFTRVSGTQVTMSAAAAKTVSKAVGWIGTDDTAALLRARDAWLASFRSNSNESGRIATKAFYFPPGDYIFQGVELFMRNDKTNKNRHRGGHVYGVAQGPGTRIVFCNQQGPTGDRSKGNLASFYWGALNFKMENISVFSMNPNLTFVWQFCSSYPLTGGQANFTWKDVELDGHWKSGWALDGDKHANMNSEQHWDHCTTRIQAKFERALFEFGGVTDSTVKSTTTIYKATPGNLPLVDGSSWPSSGEGYLNSSETGWRKIRWTGKNGDTLTGVTRATGTSIVASAGDEVVHASDQQDQFVNYQFLSCNFEYASGDVFRLWKGGAITIIGGSWILGVDQPIHDEVGHYFHMPYASHFEVCFLQVFGTRFEKRCVPTRLIKSYWAGEDVHITLDSVGMSDNHLNDLGPDEGPDSPTIEVHVNAEEGANKLPNLTVRNSNIVGHVLWDGTAAADRGGFTFDQCDFSDWRTAPIPTSGASTTGFLRWAGTKPPRYRVSACSRVPNSSVGISWS